MEIIKKKAGTWVPASTFMFFWPEREMTLSGFSRT
jgi:hypothetical protein